MNKVLLSTLLFAASAVAQLQFPVPVNLAQQPVTTNALGLVRNTVGEDVVVDAVGNVLVRVPGASTFVAGSMLPASLDRFAFADADPFGANGADLYVVEQGPTTGWVLSRYIRSAPGTYFLNASSAEVVGPAPTLVAPIELNGDQADDAVVVVQDGTTVEVLAFESLGTGPSLVSSLTFPGQDPVLAVGDADDNGADDIVVGLSDAVESSVLVFLNPSTSLQAPISAVVGNATASEIPVGLTIGDLDGDGGNEVIVANSRLVGSTQIQEVSVTNPALGIPFLTVSTLRSGAPFSLGGAPVIGQSDTDGVPDLAVPARAVGQDVVALYLGGPIALFPEPFVINTPAPTRDLSLELGALRGLIGADSFLEGVFSPEPLFIRGDVTRDGMFTMQDVVFLLGFLFQGGSAPTVLDSADVNDDGMLGMPDVLAFLNGVFGTGPAIPAPFPNAGIDPTPDNL